MGRYSKPGVSWAEIEIRWRQAEGEATLAREFGISKQAVNQRKKREGWERGYPVKERQPVVDDHWLALAHVTDTAKRLAAPSSRSDRQLLAWGKRTAENLAGILRLIERGVPEGLAAKAPATWYSIA